MAEPLKAFFSPTLVSDIADSIVAVHAKFPAKQFVRDATHGLAELELLARAGHIADALHTHLPQRFVDAIEVLVRSLRDEHATDELEGAGMAPFFYLPHTIFVARHGLDDFEASMRAQHEITRRFTCEFSIRAFLERHPEATLRVMGEWARDRNPHVRRLVSEGTRPRLPWATRVRFLEENPERALTLLELLKDDPASLVRRSVANHLNDLSKTAPTLAFDVAERWLVDAPSERRALVSHALRSAVKRGEARALSLLGFGAAPRVAISAVVFAPKRVAVGGKTRVSFTLEGMATRSQTLAVDLAVHFIKSNGKPSAKVFKISTLTLRKGESATLGKTVSLAVHTTRKPYAGKHSVDAVINGKSFPLGAFVVT